MLWAAVGKMFTAFVVYSTRLTIVYAGFAFVVAALLWTYFGWLILLAGAQLSFYVQNPTLPAAGIAAAAPLERRARAAGAEAHVLRRALARGRRAALDA